MDADKFILDSSYYTPNFDSPFVDKYITRINDGQGNSYTGSNLSYDGSGLSQSGAMPYWPLAYQTIPLVISLTDITGTADSQTAINSVEVPYAMALKSGTQNLVGQQLITVNGITVAQQITNINVLNQYRLITGLSLDGLTRMYAESAYWPDSSTSFSYGSQTGIDPAGHGILNNFSAPSFPADVYSTTSVYQGAWNEGMYKRSLLSGLDVSDAPVSSFISETIANQTGISYYKAYPAKYAKVWFYLANHKLSSLHDIFAKFPLARGVSFNINQQINQGTATFSATFAGGVLTDLSCTNITSSGQGTFPVMIANGSKEFQGIYQLLQAYFTEGGNGTYQFTLRISVGTDVTLGISHPTLTNTQLSVPCYTLSPSALELYLSRNRIKTFKYLDSFFFGQSYSVSGGQVSINAVVSNQITAPKRFWAIVFGQTYLSGAAGTPANKLVQSLSPFDSAPSGSALPWCQFFNTNVQVGGRNVFQQQEKYSYQTWLDESSQVNALNGGLDERLTSGLVSYQDFYSKLGAVVIDIGRRLSGEDLVPKAIAFDTTLYTSAADSIQIYYFIDFENTIKLDTSSGVISFNDRS